MEEHLIPRRQGRGAAYNPPTRFEPYHLEEDPAALDEADLRQVETQFFVDASKSALAKNSSPDIPFTYSINPYRGCEHGCIYCYARPSHEYLGFSAGLDFETRIVVKQDLPALLEQTFQKKSWQPQAIMFSGNTYCYQPVERRLKLTRRCLEVFAKYRNPVSIITKNYLVTRDLDILEEMASLNLVSVAMSITSLRPEITGVMEPRTSRPERRLRAVEELANRGVPVSVMVGPVVPGLTDDELPAIIEAAAERGASRAFYVMLRLPGAVKPLFIDWLEREFPDRKNKVLNRLRELRGEELTDHRFGARMRGKGHWAEVVNQMYRLTISRLNLNQQREPLSTEHFRRAHFGQGELFG